MVSNILKWVAGGLEGFLGIPILGGTIIVSLLWAPLFIMLALHIVGLVFASSEGTDKTGHILGIVTSVVGFIPFVGMIMHIVTAVFLLMEAAKNK
ncbi:hypothetical protein ACFOZY_01090 [Chungangia koreensis]|uniref:Uncharacterized protein n=1 Tax=Chungangia koreensis TaxID=752657 RepID=A0ABV8WZE6_9LACT